MFSIYLLRHGQTDYSATNRFCGDLDPPLNATGQEMAACFAREHAQLAWRAVYSSPSLRTRQTAAALANAISLPVQGSPGMREISYGRWEGLSHDEARRRDPDHYAWWAQDPTSRGAPEGETAFHMAARAVPALEEIRSAHPEGPVLLVSHKATIRVLICALLGIDVRLYRDRFDYPVAAVTCVEFKERGPFFRSIADTSHLPPHLRNLPGT